MHNHKELVRSLGQGPYTDSTRRHVEGSVKLQDAAGGAGEIHLVMTVSHDKDRKQFTSTVRIERRDGYTRACEPMNQRHYLRLPSIRIDRYSLKRLEEAWEDSRRFLSLNNERLALLDLDAVEVAS